MKEQPLKKKPKSLITEILIKETFIKMQRDLTGYYKDSAAGGEVVRAFVPLPLPPIPTLDLQGVHAVSASLNRQQLLEKATVFPRCREIFTHLCQLP
jgi:hypothetical protein